MSEGVRRRRQCLHCHSRFTTYERVQSGTFLVIKKDGRREEFSRDKLSTGIRKACTKRPISNDDIEQLVNGVEGELHHLGKIEVPSSTIGELVMKHLKELDRIAYMRFASVYREFADVDSFRQEIDALVKGQEKTVPAQLPLIPQEGFSVPAKSTRRSRRHKPGDGFGVPAGSTTGAARHKLGARR
jgi:transcriptional repressor NrdR